jgi:hypothetical protein
MKATRRKRRRSAGESKQLKLRLSKPRKPAPVFSAPGKRRASTGRSIVARLFAYLRPGAWLREEGRMHSPCWEWTGCVNREGYPLFHLRGQPVLAHRLSFAIFRTADARPGRHLIHHRCRNPRCLNPEHLVSVTKSAHNRLHGLGKGPRDEIGRWRRPEEHDGSGAEVKPFKEADDCPRDLLS